MTKQASSDLPDLHKLWVRNAFNNQLDAFIR